MTSSRSECIWSEGMSRRTCVVCRAVVWQLCGGVRGREAWRVACVSVASVPSVVRKAAKSKFYPPGVGPRLRAFLRGVSVDFPPYGKVNSKRLHRGKVNWRLLSSAAHR